MRRHVAGAARIGVVAPRAADVVGLFQNEEIDAELLQCNPCQALKSQFR
jgi:hypothetical protein